MESPEKYECVKTVAEQGTVNTLKLTYFCCHGYKNLDGRGCSRLEMTPLEETIADLEGSQFLELLVETGLEEMLDNTVSAAAGNNSLSKRQAEFPGNPEQDNTK